MVHALLGASLLLFVMWFAGLIGVFNVNLGWIFLVLSWALGIGWCGAWYLRGWRRDHPGYHFHLF
jgi:hypothetical protein